MALCLFVVVGSATGWGQTHLGAVRGRVIDPSGAAVPRASFRLVELGTNVTRSGASGGDGAFSVAQLRPGPYRLEIEVDGYKTAVREVVLTVDQQLRLDVQLELGTLTERVVVSAPTPALDRASVGLGTVVENRLIEQLPLDGRNFLDLTLLVPGAAPAALGSAGSVRGDFAFAVNGARDDANSYLLDGAYNVDQKLNTPGVRPPVDAIAEFKVLTNGYDASFGRHAGAQVNVITKSGGNRLSGTAYGFFREKGLNARNAFAPTNEPAPDYRRSQSGFSLGGPIVRDRTFFFVDYEATRLTEGITRVSNVPTLAERGGDFSQSLLSVPINPFTGQPFPGNLIPSFFQHPVGAALINLYPLPNRDVPFQNFVSSPRLDDALDHVDAKLDHHFSSGSSLSVRYSMGDRRLVEPFAGAGFALVPGYGNDVLRRGQNLLVSETHVPSSRLVNDVRVVFNRVASQVLQENQGTSLNQQVGLPDLSDDPRTWGLSLITIPGFSPLGSESNNPQETTLTTVQVLDTLTWGAGAHLIKVGADFRFTRQDGFRDVQSRGFLNFLPAVTGNALADLLLGLPAVTGGAQLDNPQRLRAQSYNAFIQDNIELRPDLTVSAGLRYELNVPPVDAADRATVYDPATGSLVPVGTNGVPRGGYEADRNNFAPRLGIAWSPGGDGQTVVRGGYGIYYDQSALAPWEGLYFNPPYFNFGLAFQFPGLPPLTLTDPFPASFPIALPPSAISFQPDLRTPFLQQWHGSVQRELGAGSTVEVSYVGSRGHNLIRGRDINQPAPSANVFNLRPNPFFADILAIESQARSRYHALQVRYQQRLRHGLSVLSSYTFGKSEDDASGFFSSSGDANAPQDHNDPGAEYGRSGFDVRHRFSLSFAYDLPFGSGAPGWSDTLVRDWQLAGIVTLQTGRPFTVALLPTVDNSNTGFSSLGFTAGGDDRPDLVGDPDVADPTANAWFDTTAFVMPSFGSFGTAGRNILDGPGFKNLNLALLRTVPIGRDARLQFRIEAFNLLNTINLHLPDNFFGSPTFGQILSAGAPRRLQLGVRLSF